MKTIFLVALSVMSSTLFSKAQSSNELSENISIVQNQSLVINYNSIDEMKMENTIQNAFSIKQIQPVPTITKIYCQVVSLGNNFNELNGKIFLANSKTFYAKIPLSMQRIEILEIPANSSISNYNLNFIISGMMNQIKTGEHNFTLQFSSTQN